MQPWSFPFLVDFAFFFSFEQSFDSSSAVPLAKSGSSLASMHILALPCIPTPKILSFPSFILSLISLNSSITCLCWAFVRVV